MVTSSQRTALLEKYRYINVEHDSWWDWVYSDFTEDMKAVGIHVSRMYFSGFCSQGDGACFEGCFDNALAYLDHHHQGEYPMIRKLLENGGGVYAHCEQRGHYYHQYCTNIYVDHGRLSQCMESRSELQEAVIEAWDVLLDKEVSDFEDAVTDQWRTYMDDLYRKLEAEYDHLTSDESVWDTIEASELDEAEADEEDEEEAYDDDAIAA